MSREELEALRNSSEAPYNNEDYTVWLHNKIIDAIQYELWNFREKESINAAGPYSACNEIICLPSLKKINYDN